MFTFLLVMKYLSRKYLGFKIVWRNFLLDSATRLAQSLSYSNMCVCSILLHNDWH